MFFFHPIVVTGGKKYLIFVFLYPVYVSLKEILSLHHYLFLYLNIFSA